MFCKIIFFNLRDADELSPVHFHVYASDSRLSVSSAVCVVSRLWQCFTVLSSAAVLSRPEATSQRDGGVLSEEARRRLERIPPASAV